MQENPPVNAYDEVPYPSLSYPQTHPDRLATLATLHGLRPAPVDHCRVLEVGCAGGGNLIPMAEALPDSEFVGIDLSARQLAAALAVVRELGLKN
jgi:tRNA G46 methylase TrmB